RESLDQTQNQIGQLALALAEGFNAQHRLGQDLNGDRGGDFFDIGGPTVYANDDNAGNAVLDIEQRKPIYHQLYKVLADDPPVILLGYREILSASSARVSGFKPDIY
ncbi:hypothetical protein GUG53_25120, partial [Xanthomonas citri pv. citri]|nr:hypothetical protein [Xanthomonas citri pv. citri]